MAARVFARDKQRQLERVGEAAEITEGPVSRPFCLLC
jgi:hypothetical protein